MIGVVVVVKVVVVVVREDYRLVLKVRIFDRNLPLRLNKVLFCKIVVTIVVDLKSLKKNLNLEFNFIEIIGLA